MRTVSKIMSLAVLILVIVSCDKEGPQGEAGIAGQNGIDGTDGTNGTNGTNGEDGNANVIASPWIPEQFSETPSSYSDFNYSDPDLTSEITDNAAILVYGRAGTGAVVSIPIVFSNQTFYYGINSSANQMFFVGETIDNADRLFTTFSDFRYVIIPDSDNSTGKNGQPDFSKMSYEEVMDHFALEY